MTDRRPLLSGASRDAALAALDDASRALLAFDTAAVDDATYLAGAAGMAIAHAQLHRVFPERAHDRRSVALIERAFEIGENTELGLWLGSGGAGVEWTAEFLGTPQPEPTYMDEEVRAALEQPDPSTEWMHGIASFVVYAESRPERIAREIGRALAKTLAREAIRTEHGFTWLARGVPVPPLASVPFYDFGLAHGIPGTLLALAHLVRRAWGDEETMELLAGGCRELLHQRLVGVPEDGCIFPGFKMAEPKPARLAYCYGDAGVVWALHAAALALDDEALRRECASLAERTARLRGERLHVVDGGLCHGGAGLAHIFQRLYRDTANEVFADAARDWLDSVCSQRDRSAPFGFTLQAHKVTDTGRAGLLFGVSGIALTLMSALDLTDVAWDAPILG